ncbi:hypothetical protein ACU4GD_00775 [Cupriavidus basilensis]
MIARMLLALALLACAHAAAAGQPGATLDTVPSSGHSAFQGQPFFLLSDASFGSDQTRAGTAGSTGARIQERAATLRGGADVLVYRVADPIAFLKAQRSLHRIDVKANYRGEGLANTLSYLWDSWYKQARRAVAARAVVRHPQQGGGGIPAVQHGGPDRPAHPLREQSAV